MARMPQIERRFNPATQIEETRVVMVWDSEEDYRKWIQEILTEAKPALLRQQQEKARELFKDIFGVELK